MTSANLTKDGVVELFCSFLGQNGWVIHQRRGLGRRDIDIIASRTGPMLYAAAKGAIGATSEKEIDAYRATRSALMQACSIRNLE